MHMRRSKHFEDSRRIDLLRKRVTIWRWNRTISHTVVSDRCRIQPFCSIFVRFRSISFNTKYHDFIRFRSILQYRECYYYIRPSSTGFKSHQCTSTRELLIPSNRKLLRALRWTRQWVATWARRETCCDQAHSGVDLRAAAAFCPHEVSTTVCQ